MACPTCVSLFLLSNDPVAVFSISRPSLSLWLYCKSSTQSPLSPRTLKYSRLTSYTCYSSMPVPLCRNWTKTFFKSTSPTLTQFITTLPTTPTMTLVVVEKVSKYLSYTFISMKIVCSQLYHQINRCFFSCRETHELVRWSLLCIRDVSFCEWKVSRKFQRGCQLLLWCLSLVSRSKWSMEQFRCRHDVADRFYEATFVH